jgi:rifampicin phosphotransferase
MSADTPFQLPLDSAHATLQVVGGKGASLARIATAGLPVPPGFHVTTAAYRRFVEANALQAVIAEATANAQPDDPASLERASAAVRRLFRSGAVPEGVATAIQGAYTSLGTAEPTGAEPAVAVRSSATAEDLPGLSFAGQYESYLNVRGESALLAAVRRCWDSLWTARAISYRLRNGVDQRAVAMAVVVQRLVLSEASGVLFTANPTTGDRDEVVINASFGLGEAVVSGDVTPDRYVLSKPSREVKEVSIGAKESMVLPADGAAGQGTKVQDVAEQQRAEQALPASLIRELSALAVCVERLNDGVPQDIEWAVAEGRCWLLQARPMTALPPAPLRDVRWEPPTPGSAWIRRQVVENMPEPLSPLFEELYLDGLEESANAMQAAMGVPRGFLDRLFDRPMFATVNGYAYMRGNINLRWWSVPVLVPLMLGAMAVGVTKLLLRNAGITYWRDDVMPRYLATIARWKAVDPAHASDEQLLDGVRALARADALYWFAVALAMGTAKSTDVALDRFLAFAVRRGGPSSARLLRGFGSKVLDAEAELEGIAAAIRGSDALRTVVEATPALQLLDALERDPSADSVLEGLQWYFERYGHQIYSLDFAVPTQGEDPMPVLLSLKSLVLSPGRNVRTRQAELAREREQLAAETARSLGPFRRLLFRRILRAAQRFAPYREESLFYIGAGWPTLRRLALELGRRLVAAGSLFEPGDVFYLQTAELAAGSAARVAGQSRPDLAGLARERQELRQARNRLHPPAAVPPSFRWKMGPFDLAARESQRRDAITGPTMRGFAVSPGRVTAAASVVLSPTDFPTMRPDTILVCPTTTPAWTPLFGQARGLVTDIGGVAAHGSILAREYGIPAVMGTGNATQRIASGRLVTVDGDTGTVTLLDKG